MTKITLLIALAAVVLLSGCARFRTVQTEERYDANGELANRIKTKAGSISFWANKSSLTNWKAEQSENTQAAEVGTITQESEAIGTNTVEALKALKDLAETLQ